MATRHALPAAVAAAITLHVALLIDYLGFPAYLDHGEAAVVIQSWWLLHGVDLYASPWSPDYAIAPYGPVAYGINAIMLWLLGGSVLTSKLGAAAASLAAVALVFLAVRRRHGATIAGWAALAAESYILAQAPFSLIARPDSWALLFASLGLVAATTDGRKGAALLGLCAGLLLSLKVHMVLALLPATASLMMTGKDRPVRAFLVTACGLAGAALPWIVVGGSVANYLETLRVMVADRKFLPGLFMPNLLWLGGLAAPSLLAMGLSDLRQMPKADLCYVLLLVVVLALIFVPASMEGAFWNHFIAFIPASAEGFARMLARVPTGRPRRLGLAVLCGGMVLWPLKPQTAMWATLAAQRPFMDRGAAEIDRTLARHPGKTVELAPGGDYWRQSYLLTLLQPRLAFRNQPVTVVSNLDMESAYLGLPMPARRMKGLSDCRTVWLVPRGEAPLSLISPYGEPAVWPEARALFLEDKVRVEQGDQLDIWTCAAGRTEAPTR